jgi:hypothetical protein
MIGRSIRSAHVFFSGPLLFNLVRSKIPRTFVDQLAHFVSYEHREVERVECLLSFQNIFDLSLAAFRSDSPLVAFFASSDVSRASDLTARVIAKPAVSNWF